MFTLPLIVFFSIGCHGTNGSIRILRRIYKPYGPLMCKDLCDSSKDFYVYIQNDLTCRRHQNNSENVESGLNVSFTHLMKGTIKNSSKSLTATQQLGICDNQDLSHVLQRKILDSALKEDQKYHRVIHQACREGKLCMVQYILSKSLADINCRGKKGRTPVMVAARSGQAAVFDFLVSQDCDMDVVNDYKNNLLHEASRGGNPYIVKKLVDSGIYDIDIKGRYGFTPLFMAVDCGHREVFDFLRRSNGCNLRAVSKTNGTILHLALARNHVDLIRHIISLDVINIDSVERHGYIPMMIAISKNNIEAVNLLVSKGCSLTAVDNDGDNILHHACMNGNMTMIKFILSVSQNVLSIDSRGRRELTPVMLAEQWGRRDVVKLLMSKGCSLTAVEDEGYNVLHCACLHGHVAIVEDILSQDIDLIESRGKRGYTPVMAATFMGHIKVVKLLVRKGCNLRAIDSWNKNILYAACERGHIDIVKYILSLKAVSINSRDVFGKTPILSAAQKGHTKVVELLVNRNCYVKAVDLLDNNILHAACSGGHKGLVKYLLSRRFVDITAKNKKGMTPVQLARYEGNLAIVALFRQLS